MIAAIVIVYILVGFILALTYLTLNTKDDESVLPAVAVFFLWPLLVLMTPIMIVVICVMSGSNYDDEEETA